MRQMTYSEAMAIGIQEALAEDERVVLMGAGFGGLRGDPAVWSPLRENFRDRITNPPIAELGYCGIAVGAALTGLRPIVAIGTGSFSFEAFPQIANEAPQAHYGTRGQVTCPVVFHMRAGIRGAGALQHSIAPQAMYWNTPGLEICVPGSPADVRGLIKAAVRSDNPTIFIDHERLHPVVGDVDESGGDVPLGVADVKREGSDVTIVATSIMVPRALEAAATLADQGTDAEVVDPRTLVPLDKDAILRSVAKTGRVVVADETQRSCGVASEIAATIAEEGFESLRAPIRRVAIPNVPIPYHQAEEDYITPTAGRIVEAVQEICR
ncbi:MAG: alpha-ketoacid dehydrogenase subunit beta [Chloroflexota bacterium]|nr:alpha-ketoacid dehydrogenase subunit beta [Chloroflexota bacterium]MDE2885268.1 alpha-ketoacid dehydrogenase subunit beta [Chloroflexota bacterium]